MGKTAITISSCNQKVLKGTYGILVVHNGIDQLRSVDDVHPLKNVRIKVLQHAI